MDAIVMILFIALLAVAAFTALLFVLSLRRMYQLQKKTSFADTSHKVLFCTQRLDSYNFHQTLLDEPGYYARVADVMHRPGSMVVGG